MAFVEGVLEGVLNSFFFFRSDNACISSATQLH
jgi:hypothetical protein